MSILSEYEDIKKQIGEDKWNAIDKYIEGEWIYRKSWLKEGWLLENIKIINFLKRLHLLLVMDY